MPVTLRDIAKRADVSHATVSVVLNHRTVPIIGERTRQKVLRIAEEMGYQPNHLARALATGRSYIIAAWVVEPYDPYAAQTLSLLQTLMKQGPYALMAVDVPAVGMSDLPSRSHWPVDGIIAIDCPWRVTDALQGAEWSKTPMVSLGGAFSTATDYVGIEVKSGIRDAISHLTGSGRRRIALLAVDNPAATDVVKQAYMDALSESGLVPEVLNAAGATRYAGREAVLARLDQPNPPDAILASNDLLAIGALKGLRDRQVAVPCTIALVSCCGTDELAYVDPAITVVEHPILNLCEMGWQFLQNRLTAPNAPPQQLMLKPQLVVRGSSSS